MTSSGSYPEGRHEATVRYRVAGAAVPTTGGWEVYIRLLDVGYSDGDRVQIRADELAATGLTLRCVTYPPDTEPCGLVSGPTLIDVFTRDVDPQHPPEYRVDIRADNAAVPQPALDHH